MQNNKLLNINLIRRERRRPKSQAQNRPTTSSIKEKKTYTEQKSFDLHTWVDFEDQIRKIALKSFHSTIEQKPKIRKQQPNQKQYLQSQFRDILKDVLQMNLRNDLYNKLSKFI